MFVEPKLENPVRIKVDGTKSVMKFEDKEEIPLDKGVMLGKDEVGRYGIVIEIDNRETKIPSQFRIDAAEFRDGNLYVYEENKRSPWRFGQDGTLLHSPNDELTDEFVKKYKENLKAFNLVLETPELIKPVIVRLGDNQTIISDEEQEQDPLFPGVIYESIHYGFKIAIEKDGHTQETSYKTKNRIDGIGGTVGTNTFNVFERNTGETWEFDTSGKLIKKPSVYNEHEKEAQQKKTLS